MIESLHINKYYSDSYMSSNIGTFFEHDDSWTIINSNESKIIYHNNILLAKIIRKVIPDNICQLGYDNFIDAAKIISTNRGSAAGQQSRIIKNKYDLGIPVNSSIIVYMNSTNHKRPCRLTEFTKNNINKFENAHEFVATINKLFETHIPDKYAKQYNKALETHFHIKNTAFSTITVNYNFRTALHKDSGDYSDGFGNIVVIKKNINGGYLLLPQYKLAIDLDTGDYCAFNVHEWHCNSNIIQPEINLNSYRLSFVFYLRDKLEKCNKINNNLQQITGNLNGKQWNTELIFNEIFKECDKLPQKEYIYSNNKWWQMKSNRYLLEYKNKRYRLFDLEKNVVIHNLMNAWEYISTNA